MASFFPIFKEAIISGCRGLVNIFEAYWFFMVIVG